MSKYYTPSIEEFHSGFEFEAYNSRDKYFFEKEEGWYKNEMSFGVLGNLENIQRLILDNQVRVKHLDAEDIESLGFKHIGSLWFEHNKDSSVRIRKWKGFQVDIYNNYSDGEEHRVFRGEIKNKSELKRLLKQLGIN